MYFKRKLKSDTNSNTEHKREGCSTQTRGENTQKAIDNNTTTK